MCWNSTPKWAVTRSLCTSGCNTNSCYTRHYDEHHKPLYFVDSMYLFFFASFNKGKLCFLARSQPNVLVVRMRRFLGFFRTNSKKRFLASSYRYVRLHIRPSVRPSVCLSAWNNSAPTGRIFMKFWYLSIFRKLVEKIQVSSKPHKNNRYFAWRRIHIFDNT